jgi:hypothetical protein
MPAKLNLKIEDDEILSNITTVARGMYDGDMELRGLVLLACEADLDRAEVVDAIVAGGWSEGWARSLISTVYKEKGKPANKPGQGRQIPIACISLAQSAMQRHGDKAVKMLRAAIRLIESRGAKVMDMDAV